MANPSLPTTIKKTSERQWIGCLDGLLYGFSRLWSSSNEEIKIAEGHIIDFIFQWRHTGLTSLNNRIAQIGESDWKKDEGKQQFLEHSSTHLMVKHYMQDVKKALNKWKSDGHKRHTFSIPKPNYSNVFIVNKLLAFAKGFMQFTPIEEWLTPGDSYRDNKFTHFIIDAFWKTHDDYPQWISEKDAWDARVTFGGILAEAITCAEFPFLNMVEGMDQDCP